jgi:hypothetical protein
MRFGIVSSISLKLIWPATRSAALAFDAWNLVEQWEQLGNIMTVGPGQGNSQGDAVGIGEQMVLAPQFALIRGIWASFLTSTRSTQGGAIHESTIPIDLVSSLEFRKQGFENTLPNPCFLPLAKAAQARVSGGKIPGGREPSPRDTRPQDEENASDNPTGLSRLSSGELNIAVLLGLRDQRLQAFPQVIRQNRLSHEETSSRGLSLTPADPMPIDRKGSQFCHRL